MDLPRAAAPAVAVPVKIKKKVPTISARPARSMFAGWIRWPCNPSSGRTRELLLTIALASTRTLGARTRLLSR